MNSKHKRQDACIHITKYRMMERRIHFNSETESNPFKYKIPGIKIARLRWRWSDQGQLEESGRYDRFKQGKKRPKEQRLTNSKPS